MSSLCKTFSTLGLVSLLITSSYSFQITPFLTHPTRKYKDNQATVDRNSRSSFYFSTFHPIGSSTLNGFSNKIRTTTKNTLFSSSSSEGTIKQIATEPQLLEYAESVGVKLSLTTLGPGFRAVARAAHDEEQILGYCEGFVRPGGKILHVDKLECWKKALDRAKAENPDGFKNGGQVFGVSLLLGYMSLLYGNEKNCAVAEFLAIDDEEFQHKRLVRFFKRAGFRAIRYVGEDISNVPDRLVWGGCGTLMNQDIPSLLKLWDGILFKK